MNVNINDLTLGQIKEIQKICAKDVDVTQQPTVGNAYPVGKNVIVRTVTMIYTGKLVEVTNSDFILKECSWIPETGRYMDFVANGTVNECEPYPDDLEVFINRGALLDMCELRKSLPRKQK